MSNNVVILARTLFRMSTSTGDAQSYRRRTLQPSAANDRLELKSGSIRIKGKTVFQN